MSEHDSFYYKNEYELISIKSRRKFTPQEDENLKILITRIGTHNWEIISQYMPGRTAKQCRDRFCNYLIEPHTNEPWSNDEDNTLLRLLSIVGPKWTKIAQHLPKRSGNDVKNRWYKHLSKKYYPLMSNIFANSPSNKTNEKNSSEYAKKHNFVNNNNNTNNNNSQQYWGKYDIASLLL